MRHFLALLLLFINIFCGYINPVYSNAITAHNALVIQSSTEKSHHKTEIYNYVNNEHALLRKNNDSEIYTSAIRETGGSGENNLINNIFHHVELYISFAFKSTDVYNNISSHLEHEICTRAP